MIDVSTSEFEANLDRYLGEARRGLVVTVLDRGVPIARLVPADIDQSLTFDRLVEAGVMTRPSRPNARWVLDTPPISLPCSILEALLEERASGR